MKFKGKKQYKIDFGSTPSATDAEDVSIRFATIDADGDIVETSGQNGAILKFGLEEGVGVAIYDVGGEQKVRNDPVSFFPFWGVGQSHCGG